ncbi:11543_t:CDS:1, partial [Dentiscutata heterogama]
RMQQNESSSNTTHIDQILSRAKLEAAIKNLERELSKNRIETFDKPKY